MLTRTCCIAVFLLGSSVANAGESLRLINVTMEAAEEQQDAPDGWTSTYAQQHTWQNYTYRSASSAWQFWYEGTIRQELTGELPQGAKLRFGGYLFTPSKNALRHGKKCGKILIEFYNNKQEGKLLKTVTARPIIAEDSARNEWIRSSGIAVIPKGTERIEFVVSCDECETGQGAFYADDVFLEKID